MNMMKVSGRSNASLFSRAILLCTALLLSACWYHLAGYGRGVVPVDVKTVYVFSNDNDAKAIVPLLRDYVREHADGYTVTTDQDVSDAELYLSGVSESFTPSAYDSNGVATTYDLVVSGSLSLLKKGETIWSSGSIQVRGTVYAVGDPVSIEASRTRMRSDLQQQWVQEAWLRLASGF